MAARSRQYLTGLRAIFYLLIPMGHAQVFSQCFEDSILLVNETVCIGENILISSAAESISFKWDFCGSDLDSIPEIGVSFTNSASNIPVGLSLINEDGTFHLISTSRINNQIFLHTYTNGLTSEPTFTNTISDPLFSGPEWIELVKEGDDWVAFVLNFTNHHILRLTFQDSISNIPLVEDLGDLGGRLSLPRGLELAKQDNAHYLFVTDYNLSRIFRVPFQNNWLGNIDLIGLDTLGESASINRPFGISLIDSCDTWYGVLSSYNGNKYFLMDFGTDLNSEPIITDLGVGPSRPVDIKWVQEGEFFYAFGGSESGNLYKLEFGSSPSSLQSFTNIGNFSGSLSNAYGFDMAKEGSVWHGFSMNYLNKVLSRMDFPEKCDASVFGSAESTPTGLFYSSAGIKTITLKSTNVAGDHAFSSKQVTVLNTNAPDISFTVDTNRCISNPTSFTTTNISSNITTYSWDFDGDGLEDSSDPNPTYQFLSAGAYDVRLIVESDEGCENFDQQEITIYPEPPIPVFSLSRDSICVGEAPTITNSTDDTIWDGLVNYRWSVTDFADTTVFSPEFVFTSPGQKIIELVSQIPGCESVAARDTIQVVTSPNVDFEAAPACDGELTVFSNTSDIGSMFWDFGDGTTTDEANPTHQYAEPGTYTVELTVTNDVECSTTLIKNVEVNAIPVADFNYEILCKGSESLFEDMSIVDQADIIAWQWSVDGEVRSDLQSPELIFSEAGEYTVNLLATSSDGCESAFEEIVTVGPIPAVDFDVDIGCIDAPTVFNDLTDPSSVLSRSWIINGQSTADLNPSQIFTESGDYQASLTVTNNELCSSSITKAFTIDEHPIPQFVINGACNNEPIDLEDTSVDFADPITSRSWLVDGQQIADGINATLSGYQPGSYNVTLETTTENGCLVMTSQQLDIRDNPSAAFTASNDYGVPPFQLTFINSSVGVSVNEWYVNDQLITTNPDPSINFNETGDQLVSLVTYNSFGCADTASMIVSSVMPVVDLVISDIQLEESGSEYSIVLNVLNESNLPIEALSVNVELQNQFSVTEQVFQRINAGQQSVITLNTSVPISNDQLAYLCVSLGSAYSQQEIDLEDNEACINIQPTINFEDPFPNPAFKETSLRYILPESAKASLEVFDMSGNLEIKRDFEALPKGLNTIKLELTDLDAGMYVVRFTYQGNAVVSRIIKL